MHQGASQPRKDLDRPPPITPSSRILGKRSSTRWKQEAKTVAAAGRRCEMCWCWHQHCTNKTRGRVPQIGTQDGPSCAEGSGRSARAGTRCRTRSGPSPAGNHARRVVGIRIALRTTGRLFWHRGAHTAEPKIGPMGPIPMIPYHHQNLLFSMARGAMFCAGSQSFFALAAWEGGGA